MNGDIVQVDRVVIELAPIGNGVFQSRDALLNGDKLFNGFKVWILLGHRKECS